MNEKKIGPTKKTHVSGGELWFKLKNNMHRYYKAMEALINFVGKKGWPTNSISLPSTLPPPIQGLHIARRRHIFRVPLYGFRACKSRQLSKIKASPASK